MNENNNNTQSRTVVTPERASGDEEKQVDAFFPDRDNDESWEDLSSDEDVPELVEDEASTLDHFQELAEAVSWEEVTDDVASYFTVDTQVSEGPQVLPNYHDCELTLASYLMRGDAVTVHGLQLQQVQALVEELVVEARATDPDAWPSLGYKDYIGEDMVFTWNLDYGQMVSSFAWGLWPCTRTLQALECQVCYELMQIKLVWVDANVDVDKPHLEAICMCSGYPGYGWDSGEESDVVEEPIDSTTHIDVWKNCERQYKGSFGNYVKNNQGNEPCHCNVARYTRQKCVDISSAKDWIGQSYRVIVGKKIYLQYGDDWSNWEEVWPKCAGQFYPKRKWLYVKDELRPLSSQKLLAEEGVEPNPGWDKTSCAPPKDFEIWVCTYLSIKYPNIKVRERRIYKRALEEFPEITWRQVKSFLLQLKARGLVVDDNGSPPYWYLTQYGALCYKNQSTLVNIKECIRDFIGLFSEPVYAGKVYDYLKMNGMVVDWPVFFDLLRTMCEERILKNTFGGKYSVFVKDLTTEGIEPNPGPILLEVAEWANAIQNVGWTLTWCLVILYCAMRVLPRLVDTFDRFVAAWHCIPHALAQTITESSSRLVRMIDHFVRSWEALPEALSTAIVGFQESWERFPEAIAASITSVSAGIGAVLQSFQLVLDACRDSLVTFNGLCARHAPSLIKNVNSYFEWKKYTMIAESACKLFDSLSWPLTSTMRAWAVARTTPMANQSTPMNSEGFQRKTNQWAVLGSTVAAAIMFIGVPVLGYAKSQKLFEPIFKLLEKVPYVSWLVKWLHDWGEGKATFEDIPEEIREVRTAPPDPEKGVDPNWLAKVHGAPVSHEGRFSGVQRGKPPAKKTSTVEKSFDPDYENVPQVVSSKKESFIPATQTDKELRKDEGKDIAQVCTEIWDNEKQLRIFVNSKNDIQHTSHACGLACAEEDCFDFWCDCSCHAKIERADLENYVSKVTHTHGCDIICYDSERHKTCPCRCHLSHVNKLCDTECTGCSCLCHPVDTVVEDVQPNSTKALGTPERDALTKVHNNIQATDLLVRTPEENKAIAEELVHQGAIPNTNLPPGVRRPKAKLKGRPKKVVDKEVKISYKKLGYNIPRPERMPMLPQGTCHCACFHHLRKKEDPRTYHYCQPHGTGQCDKFTTKMMILNHGLKQWSDHVNLRKARDEEPEDCSKFAPATFGNLFCHAMCGVTQGCCHIFGSNPLCPNPQCVAWQKDMTETEEQTWWQETVKWMDDCRAQLVEHIKAHPVEYGILGGVTTLCAAAVALGLYLNRDEEAVEIPDEPATQKECVHFKPCAIPTSARATCNTQCGHHCVHFAGCSPPGVPAFNSEPKLVAENKPAVRKARLRYRPNRAPNRAAPTYVPTGSAERDIQYYGREDEDEEQRIKDAYDEADELAEIASERYSRFEGVKQATQRIPVRRQPPQEPLKLSAKEVARMQNAINKAKAAHSYSNKDLSNLVASGHKMVSESMLGKTKLSWSLSTGRVFKFLQDGAFHSTATVVGNKVVVPLHSYELGRPAEIANESGVFKLDGGVIPIADDLGVFVTHGQISGKVQDRNKPGQTFACRLRPPVGEQVVLFAYTSDDQVEPAMSFGWCSKDGYYNAATTFGDCGGPVYSANDGAIVGFHIAGGEATNKFIPVTDDMLNKIKLDERTLRSSLFQ
jgi:hypothetical protein